MKYFIYIRCLAILSLVVQCILFSSCKTEDVTKTLENVTYKQSLDFATAHESGPSRIIYIKGSGVNYISYTETTIFGFKMSGTLNKENEDAWRNIYSVTDKSNEGSYGAIGYGLEYINKGAKLPDNGGKIRLNYIEVPIHFLYHYPIGNGNVYTGFGPYFAYGVGGKEGDISSFGDNNGGFKRFDAGIGFMLGYKLNMGVSLDIGYELGLANIEYADEDVKGYNRVFSINLGYQIGKLFEKKKAK